MGLARWDKPMQKCDEVPGVVKTAGPTKRARRAKAAKDRRYAKTIREEVAKRDGACRLGDWENNPYDVHSDALEGDACEGRSKWAHLGKKKRARTRGLPPEERHTTAGSLMLCTKHHDDYDDGRLLIVGEDADVTLEFWPELRKNVRPEAE